MARMGSSIRNQMNGCCNFRFKYEKVNISNNCSSLMKTNEGFKLMFEIFYFYMGSMRRK